MTWLEIILPWIITTILTELSKKTSIPQSYIVVWLCILWWTFYVLVNINHPDLFKLMYNYAWQIFATSQAAYILYNKFIKKNESWWNIKEW